MNLLEIQANLMKVDPNTLMDVLQNYGVVSDNCLSITDVHPKDQSYAITWLKRNPHLLKQFASHPD